MDLYASTDQVILESISARIRRCRLERNISQKKLAADAGVSVSSVAALEQGKSVSLNTLIPILRALGELELLQPFCDEPVMSPIEYARIMEGRKQRQRASTAKSSESSKESEW